MNILSARKVQAKIKTTNKKMVSKGMSFRCRLGAMLACDNRQGQVMGKLAHNRRSTNEYC